MPTRIIASLLLGLSISVLSAPTAQARHLQFKWVYGQKVKITCLRRDGSTYTRKGYKVRCKSTAIAQSVPPLLGNVTALDSGFRCGTGTLPDMSNTCVPDPDRDRYLLEHKPPDHLWLLPLTKWGVVGFGLGLLALAAIVMVLVAWRSIAWLERLRPGTKDAIRQLHQRPGQPGAILPARRVVVMVAAEPLSPDSWAFPTEEPNEPSNGSLWSGWARRQQASA
jgi:hypothetical protein